MLMFRAVGLFQRALYSQFEARLRHCTLRAHPPGRGVRGYATGSTGKTVVPEGFAGRYTPVTGEPTCRRTLRARLSAANTDFHAN